MPIQCVNDERMGGVYQVSRGQGKVLPLSLCDLCAQSMTLAEVIRLARSLHVRPAATLSITTVEAVEASKRAQKGRRVPGSTPRPR